MVGMVARVVGRFVDFPSTCLVGCTGPRATPFMELLSSWKASYVVDVLPISPATLCGAINEMDLVVLDPDDNVAL